MQNTGACCYFHFKCKGSMGLGVMKGHVLKLTCINFCFVNIKKFIHNQGFKFKKGPLRIKASHLFLHKVN